MSASISHSFDSERPPASRPAAGAASPEGVAAEHVNPQVGVVVAEPEPAYRDSVKHVSEWPAKQDREHLNCYSTGLASAEALRQSRLRRFQEQRP